MSMVFSRLARRYASSNSPFAAENRLSRREMLKLSLAASAGVMISSSPLFAGWNSRQPQGKRVVIVGGGFSGLSCAYQLLNAGYDVTVIEARNRVGGRILSFNKALGSEFIPGRNIEGGGELIGSNHPTWVGYANEFGLEWLDVGEDDDLDFPLVIDGNVIKGDEGAALYEQIEAGAAQMNALAANINAHEAWTSPDADALDKKSLKQFIDNLEVDDNTKKGIDALMSHDNGVACDKQSLLGMLACIKGHGVEAYWTDTEIYRCKGGNQQLAHKLADKIGPNRIVMRLPVTKIDAGGGGRNIIVTCGDGRTLECDDVVLAVPPSVWNKIDINPGLPGSLKPQMGSNVKYLAHVKKRYWKDSETGQYSLTNGVIGWNWDGTDGQEGEENACHTAFSGAKGAETARAWPADDRDLKYKAEYEKVFPAFGENFIAARFMDWPSEQWTGASYSFPAPGQVTTIGPILHKGVATGGAGRIHFAGEHCSYGFVGYMEGALFSGASLAQRMAVRDGLVQPAAVP